MNRAPNRRGAFAIPACYEEFPNAQWFVQMDDDTLVFPKTLEMELASYPEPLTTSYYIGHVTEALMQSLAFGRFAYGGGGMLLSRAVVEKAMPTFSAVDKCTAEAYGGDTAVGNFISRILTSWPEDIRRQRRSFRQATVGWKVA